MSKKANDKLEAKGEALGEALDEDGYERLQRDHRHIAKGVMESLRDGMTEGEVYNYVLSYTGSRELAKWCQQAARHLTNQRGE